MSLRVRNLVQGDKVIVNGSGLSEVHDGGYAEFARVPADWVVPLPPGLSLSQTMIIGTAGFTAGSRYPLDATK